MSAAAAEERIAFVTICFQTPRKGYVAVRRRRCPYVAGALTLGYSLKMCSLKSIPRVVMVNQLITDDDRQALMTVYHRIVEVDLICAEAVKMPYMGKEQFYASWLDYAFSKLRVLQLTEYDKVLFLDADVLANIHMDTHAIAHKVANAFAVEAPAGMCSAPDLGEVAEGSLVSDEQMRSAVDSQYGMRGCCMLLRPDPAAFEHCMCVLEEQQSHKDGRTGKYGDENRRCGPDEQLFSLHLENWHHLDSSFCRTSWHADMDTVFVHSVTEKPWLTDVYARWPDYDLWLEVAIACRNEHTETRVYLDDAIAKLLEMKVEDKDKFGNRLPPCPFPPLSTPAEGSFRRSYNWPSPPPRPATHDGSPGSRGRSWRGTSGSPTHNHRHPSSNWNVRGRDNYYRGGSGHRGGGQGWRHEEQANSPSPGRFHQQNGNDWGMRGGRKDRWREQHHRGDEGRRWQRDNWRDPSPDEKRAEERGRTR
ncbi:unnamed protein product [Vitrella brassicaformis CCMP3155]|uniref:Hexosyltransferase n=2 Tax=Vitrella brassicaformis TaxID=1169539 RepID=A0A0G4EYA9_VITBC|nr:unnamed protein product [Vitrella brassicaformis CCMP3155]|eukprot:CEM03430.1 unnamed protein product [Vitrella brassicaformis CCMP3155]